MWSCCGFSITQGSSMDEQCFLLQKFTLIMWGTRRVQAYVRVPPEFIHSVVHPVVLSKRVDNLQGGSWRWWKSPMKAPKYIYRNISVSVATQICSIKTRKRHTFDSLLLLFMGHWEVKFSISVDCSAKVFSPIICVLTFDTLSILLFL